VKVSAGGFATAQSAIEILIAAAAASHGGAEAASNLASPSAPTAADGIVPDCRYGAVEVVGRARTREERPHAPCVRNV